MYVLFTIVAIFPMVLVGMGEFAKNEDILERFQKPKQLLSLITIDASSVIIQSEFEPAPSAGRHVQDMVGYGFASHWLRKWREFFQPITERSEAKPKQTRITLDAQLQKNDQLSSSHIWLTSAKFSITYKTLDLALF